MIIFGYRGRDRTVGNGSFNCPNCRASRSYEHKKLQRWFTLYFVPVFPLQTLGERIVCGACGQAYTTAVLSYDPSQQEAQRRGPGMAQSHAEFLTSDRPGRFQPRAWPQPGFYSHRLVSHQCAGDVRWTAALNCKRQGQHRPGQS